MLERSKHLPQGDTPLILSGASEQRELGELALTRGSNRQVLDPQALIDLAPGDYVISAVMPDGTSSGVLDLRVLPPSEAEAPAVENPVFAARVSVVETRLQPTDLPWERFDRPDVLLDAIKKAEMQFSGVWNWVKDDTAPGGDAHVSTAGGPPVHAVLFGEPVQVITGDNIVQYLWLDPENPPDQIVIQVYDERLSGAHRLSLGADLLPLKNTGGFGRISGGPLPGAGRWMRLRIPVDEIGMDGKQVAGLAFYTANGNASFGPTRLAGGEDTSPRLVEAADRDTTGAPEVDISAQLVLPRPGQLELSLSLASGAKIPLYGGPVQAGQRNFWWQGDAVAVQGAALTGIFQPDDGNTVEINKPVTGNPSLVARLLYPPQGAVVRQTVPIFGQAGGSGFTEYRVEMRRLGGAEEDWQAVLTSSVPTVMTDEEIRSRIDGILKNELRATVYGNLASINTGSVLHRFEFAQDDNTVMKSGWIELRLQSFDAEGNFAQDATVIRVGEVATGQDQSTFVSPDGQARMKLAPFSLNVGMGTFSVDLSDQSLPAGAPAPVSDVYEFAPAGISFRAPVVFEMNATDAQSIAVISSDGRITLLASQKDGARISASVPAGLRPQRFYSTAEAAPDAEIPRIIPSAPWFEKDGEAGLMFAIRSPRASAVTFATPLPLKEKPGLVAGISLQDTRGMALLLRFDGDVRLVPLGVESLGSRAQLAVQPLGLIAKDGVTPVYLSLSDVLPAGARQLEGVELVKITSAAWRSFRAETPALDEAFIETLSIGLIPAEVSGWVQSGVDPLRPDEDGWYNMSDADGDLWPALIDRTPPALNEISPGNGTESPGLLITAQVTETGAGLATKRTELTINGVRVPADLMDFDQRQMRLAIPLGQVPMLAIPGGGDVSVRMVVYDQLGQASEPLEWNWRYKPETLAVGNLRQLTTQGGKSPAWLPAGTEILFEANRNGQSDIARLNLDSGQISWITETAENELAPAVAPDGSIAFPWIWLLLIIVLIVGGAVYARRRLR